MFYHEFTPLTPDNYFLSGTSTCILNEKNFPVLDIKLKNNHTDHIPEHPNLLYSVAAMMVYDTSKGIIEEE